MLDWWNEVNKNHTSQILPHIKVMANIQDHYALEKKNTQTSESCMKSYHDLNGQKFPA